MASTKEEYTKSYRPVKVVIVGNGSVGKTCLLIAYTTRSFEECYVPTVYDSYKENVQVDGKWYNMTLWDTAGQEGYAKLRPLAYPGTNCFLVCYSVVDKQSYANVASQWIPEIKHYCPDAGIVLVGTKIDLRLEDKPNLTPADGHRLKKMIGADEYVECSSKTQEGLHKVFPAAVRAAVKEPIKRRQSCLIM